MTPEEREAWLMRNMYPDGIKERPTLAQRQAALAAEPYDPEYDGLFSDTYHAEAGAKPPAEAPAERASVPPVVPTPTTPPNAVRSPVTLPPMHEVPPPVIPTPVAKANLPKPKVPVMRSASLKRFDPQLITNSEWHDIPSCPGYSVSKEGRVQSKPRYSLSSEDVAPRFLGASLLKKFRDGKYWKVRMRLDGRSINMPLHSIMAEVFMGPCPENHKLVVGKEWTKNPSLSQLKYEPLRGHLPRRPMTKGDLSCPTSNSESSSDSPPSSPSLPSE